jgi:hypothetical protein
MTPSPLKRSTCARVLHVAQLRIVGRRGDDDAAVALDVEAAHVGVEVEHADANDPASAEDRIELSVRIEACENAVVADDARHHVPALLVDHQVVGLEPGEHLGKHRAPAIAERRIGRAVGIEAIEEGGRVGVWQVVRAGQRDDRAVGLACNPLEVAPVARRACSLHLALDAERLVGRAVGIDARHPGHRRIRRTDTGQ